MNEIKSDNTMARQEVKRIIDALDSMPPLSPTVSKVIELANSPTSSPAELNRVISMDPVLTARVLKLINSAYFSLSQGVTNLTRAIVMLGVNTIKNLALSTALAGTLKGGGGKSGFDMDAFWEHSLSTAAMTRVLARESGVDAKILEEYFVAGLIHDIGKMIFEQQMPDDYKEVLEDASDSGISIIFSEQDILGASHDEAGLWLAQRWKLNSSLCEVIAKHHEPLTATANPHLTCIVAISDSLCKQRKLGFSGDEIVYEFPEEVYSTIKMDRIKVQQVTTDIRKDIDAARDFLRVAGS